MKFTKLKKIVAGMLAMLLAMSVFSGVALADEELDPSYEPVDSYVINYDASSMVGYEEFKNPRLYLSPHVGNMKFKSYDDGVWETYSGLVDYKVYNLINRNKVAEGKPDGATGAWASLEAYCVDLSVSAISGKVYQRANLEDSTYFDDITAGKLRAICLNSFPYIKDMKVVEAEVNAWLKMQGRTNIISGLTGAEAIAATQNAVWVTANGKDIEKSVVYTKTYSYSETWFKNNKVVFPRDEYVDSVKQKETATTKNNIEMLNEYLLALEPVGPTNKAVSEASFTAAGITRGIENGVPYITVTAKVDVDLTNSELDLTAKVGDQHQTVDIVAGKDTYTFTFANPTAETANLFIDGAQTVADVFLFRGKDRFDTQCMIAYDDSELPVHAEIEVTPDHVININKTTSIKSTNEAGETVTTVYPLEGIVFEIYFAGTVDEYTAYVQQYGEVVDENGKVSEAYVEYVKSLDIVETSVTTDASGKAFYNAGQMAGVYMLIEQDHPAIVKALDPFLVAVPMTVADGTGLTYTINLNPKNEVLPGPEVEKNVTELNKETDTFAIGQIQTWIIRGEIPVDMAIGKNYVLTDILDYRLTYKDVVKVAVEKDETSVALTEGTDYNLIVGKSTDQNGNDVDMFKVELTQAGRVLVAQTAGTDYENWEVRVYFDSIIDEDADNVAGEMIPNEVTLDYENSVGIEFTDEDDAKVFTCAINIFKHDAKDAKVALSGATFKLAKVVAEGTEGAVQLVTEKGKAEWVVYEEFYNTDEINVDDPATEEVDEATKKVNFVVTSDEEGKKGEAMIYGLAAGEYYLVETKAPAGYNLLSYPIKVTVGTAVDAETQEVVLSAADAISEVKVANSNTFKLPETGGIGTIIFTVSGGLMTLAGGTILALKKREEE